jgi:predicted nucleic acid-binding protein
MSEPTSGSPAAQDSASVSPLVYLDYNCFQRGFDDPAQVRIQMEALACQEVFARAARSEITLAWSFMHEDETILCPFPARRQEAFRLATLCQVRVAPAAAIRTLAQSFQAQSGLSAKDALHLACATQVGAVCFVTCDDGLIRQAKRLRLALAILNPVDYTRQVGR